MTATADSPRGNHGSRKYSPAVKRRLNAASYQLPGIRGRQYCSPLMNATVCVTRD